MACSVRKSPNAFVAEVARFLAIEPADVQRHIDCDGLPAIEIPKRTRMVTRIYLPSFHAWLVKRARNADATLRSYETFLKHFDETARRPAKGRRPEPEPATTP